MKALGGRGMWLAGFFLEWAMRRGEVLEAAEGNSRDSEGALPVAGVDEEGSLKVTGVTFAANAKPLTDGSTGRVHTSC